MHKKFIKVSAVAFALALASGCAQVTKEEFEAVKSTANTALSEARAAKSSADSAASAAAAAQSTADEAKRMAAEANACCQANSDKIEKLFKEKMKK
jgi:predicted  nucleic acid-binding Zn-ribbon protein